MSSDKSTVEQPRLRAWSNGCEVVAALDEEGAREVLRGLRATGPTYAESELDGDGDGWHALDESLVPHEAGTQPGPDDPRIARLLEGLGGKPAHLWSIEQ